MGEERCCGSVQPGLHIEITGGALAIDAWVQLQKFLPDGSAGKQGPQDFSKPFE